MVKGVHGRLSFEVRTITILDSPMKSTIDDRRFKLEPCTTRHSEQGAV